MDITPYVGPAFRQLREHAEISQEELAFRAGLDRTYVSGIERGRRNPSLKSMQRVADQLGKSLDEVFNLARKLAEKGPDQPSSGTARKEPGKRQRSVRT